MAWIISLKPSVGELLFVTEGRIPPLKRLFIKERGAGRRDGLESHPDVSRWSLRRSRATEVISSPVGLVPTERACIEWSG